jgi:starvation-inducible outer membrane lipoprotein
LLDNIKNLLLVDKKFTKLKIVPIIICSLAIYFAGCFALNTAAESGSSSKSSSSSVPDTVRKAAEEATYIDKSNGGKIINITGSKNREFPDGTELWDISVDFIVAAGAPVIHIDTMVRVRIVE